MVIYTFTEKKLKTFNEQMDERLTILANEQVKLKNVKLLLLLLFYFHVLNGYILHIIFKQFYLFLFYTISTMNFYNNQDYI